MHAGRGAAEGPDAPAPQALCYRALRSFNRPRDVALFDQVRALRNAHTNQLGFIPQQGIRRHARHGRLIVATEDYDSENLIGFCLCGGSRGELIVHQLCVRPDWRLRGVGRMLLEHALLRGASNGDWRATAKVRAALPAVGFWRAMAWRETGRVPAGARRGGELIVFECHMGD